MVKEIQEHIASVEKDMMALLSGTQSKLKHRGNRGSGAEDHFRKSLARCLPINFAFGHGEVIDSIGNRSKQTDAVILSQDHPGTFTPELPALFYVEAVLAAAQVKSVLTTGELKSALTESEAFKKLRIYNQAGAIMSSIKNPAENRSTLCPPFLLFAYHSQLTLKKVFETVVEFQASNKLAHGQLVDAIFLLDRGWIINFGDGNEALQFGLREGGVASGWVAEGTGDVLMRLIQWLSYSMREVVYQPPIPRVYLAPAPRVAAAPTPFSSRKKASRR